MTFIVQWIIKTAFQKKANIEQCQVYLPILPTWSNLVRDTKQLLGTISLTNNNGCWTIIFNGWWSLTLVKSTSKAPYNLLPNVRSELYSTFTPAETNGWITNDIGNKLHYSIIHKIFNFSLIQLGVIFSMRTQLREWVYEWGCPNNKLDRQLADVFY